MRSKGESHNKDIQKFIESCKDSVSKNAVSNEIIQNCLQDKHRDPSSSLQSRDDIENVVDSNTVSNDIEEVRNEDTSAQNIVMQITTDRDEEIIDSCTDPILKNALICNVKKRRMLEQLYQQLETELLKLNENTPGETEDRLNRCRLGAPYFKDKFSFPSPPNHDFINIVKNKKLLWIRKKTVRKWTMTDKNKLAIAVYKEICTKNLACINKEIHIVRQSNNEDKTNILANLFKERNVFNDVELVEKLAATWIKNSTQQIVTNNAINIKTPLASEKERIEAEKLIIKTVSEWTDIDWHQISVQVLNSRHTERECRAEWTCYMNPKFNKRPWTQYENRKLRVLAQDYNYQNWDQIGCEMNRSALQCCVHFQTRLCERYRRDKWTKQEDELLIETVKLCTDEQNKIQWSSVAYYFKNRTKFQIYNRYTYCLAPKIKKGAFTIPEDILLIVTARLYNNNFSKILPYFPNRKSPQLRSHFSSMRKNVRKQWTVEEDAKVIEHVQRYGSKRWNKLDLQRSPHCIRHRYIMLRQWFDANPDGKLTDIKRRQLYNWHKKKQRRNCIIDFIVDKLWTKIQNTPDQEKRETLLTISFIEGLLKEVPDYKRQIFRKLPRSSKSGTIDELLKDFFKPTFRFLGRNRSVITDEAVEQSVNRTELILQVLQAKLKLPSLDQIADYPGLSDLDKQVLEQLIRRQSSNVQPTSVNNTATSSVNNGASTSQMQCIPVKPEYVFPVSAETLVGFRSLLLHYSTLLQHSKYQYDGYIAHLYKSMNKLYEMKDTNTIKKEKATYMLIPETNEHKVQIECERQLFTNRFNQLFKWVSFMSDNHMIPSIEPIAGPSNEPEVEIEVQKQGRPKKNNYKVELMNKARRLKREQMNKNDNSIVVEEENLEPVTKKAKMEHNVKEMTNENSVKSVRKISKTAADINSKTVTEARVTRNSKCKENI